ncbi:MAG: hypothetical protein K6U80_19170 [Firmicutes bacterium]|nr:hypothetical protein [Bacillota bacterium]
MDAKKVGSFGDTMDNTPFPLRVCGAKVSGINEVSATSPHAFSKSKYH